MNKPADSRTASVVARSTRLQTRVPVTRSPPFAQMCLGVRIRGGHPCQPRRLKGLPRLQRGATLDRSVTENRRRFWQRSDTRLGYTIVVIRRVTRVIAALGSARLSVGPRYSES